MGIKRSDVRTFVVALAAVAVGTNAPAIAHGVHAAFSHNSDKVDGIHAAKANAGNKKSRLIATDSTGKFPVSVIPKADADTLDGNDSSDFAPSIHPHSGADITSGEVDESKIDADIARDSEITNHNHDGVYSPTGHGHAGSDITSGTVDAARIDGAIARDSELPTAGPGLTNNAGAFQVDQSTIQARVSGTCPANTFMQSITAGGSVNCGSDPGDITGIATGLTSGLTGGTTSGNATLAVDFSTAQRRIGTACNAGSSIRAIDVNGTPTCEVDDNSGGDITAVTAGQGLTGGGTTGPVTLSPDFTTAGGNFNDNGFASTVARGDHMHDSRYDARYLRTNIGSTQFVSGPVEFREGVWMGNGKLTTEGPNFPLFIRRINSERQQSNSVVALSGDPDTTSSSAIMRDGTQWGLKFVANDPFHTLTCMGVTANGAVVGKALVSDTSPQQQIFASNSGVVSMTCTFGNTTGALGDSTELTIRRDMADSGAADWVGHMVTTTNQ